MEALLRPVTCPLINVPRVQCVWQLRRHISSAATARSNTTELYHDLPSHIPPAIAPLPSPSVASPPRVERLKEAKPFSHFLTDNFHRQHTYLRISVTERCNLRCTYCMPAEGVPLSPAAHLLTTPEIVYLSELFVKEGVTKIRLTGGEPTVRKDILPLMHEIGGLRSKGLRELCLTTNGLSLHRKLDAMVEAGLTGVNLSLDTLDPYQFQIMTRRKGFDAVMKSLDRLLEMNRLGAGIKLKLNVVVMRGVNERDIVPFVELGKENDIEVRFIEYMPFDGNKWSQQKMLSYKEMVAIIQQKYPGLSKIQEDGKNETSKTWRVPGFKGKVGFITSMTENFCGTCNRLRITGDGNLKVCLFGNTEVSLRDLLRKENDGEPIDQAAIEAMKQVEMDRHQGRHSTTGPLGYSERERGLLDIIGMAVKRKKERHAGMGQLENMKNRPMILIDDESQHPLTARSINSSAPLFTKHQHGLQHSLQFPHFYPFPGLLTPHTLTAPFHTCSPHGMPLNKGKGLEHVNRVRMDKGLPPSKYKYPSTLRKEKAFEMSPSTSTAPIPSKLMRKLKKAQVGGQKAKDDVILKYGGTNFAQRKAEILAGRSQAASESPASTFPINAAAKEEPESTSSPMRWKLNRYTERAATPPRFPTRYDAAADKESEVSSSQMEWLTDRYPERAATPPRSATRTDVATGEEPESTSVPREWKMHRDPKLSRPSSTWSVNAAVRQEHDSTSTPTQWKMKRDPEHSAKYGYSLPPSSDSISQHSSQTLSQPSPSPPRSAHNTSRSPFETQSHSQQRLPHLTPSSTVHQISISHKPSTIRAAVAVGTVTFSHPDLLPLIQRHALAKGDVLAVARVAGIMTVKNTAALIPLAHAGVAVEGCTVDLELVDPGGATHLSWTDGREPRLGNGAVGGGGGMPPHLRSHAGAVRIRVRVQSEGKTGVEMEAMAGVVGAALTVVDMCKGVDKHLSIDEVKVVGKKGGKSGAWGDFAAVAADDERLEGDEDGENEHGVETRRKRFRDAIDMASVAGRDRRQSSSSSIVEEEEEEEEEKEEDEEDKDGEEEDDEGERDTNKGARITPFRPMTPQKAQRLEAEREVKGANFRAMQEREGRKAVARQLHEAQGASRGDGGDDNNAGRGGGGGVDGAEEDADEEDADEEDVDEEVDGGRGRDDELEALIQKKIRSTLSPPQRRAPAAADDLEEPSWKRRLREKSERAREREREGKKGRRVGVDRGLVKKVRS